MIPAPVQVLLEMASPLALHELERALRIHLHPPHTAADRRLSELGPLARMLRSVDCDPRAGQRVVERAHYEATRPPDAPRAQTLAKRYGDWRRACRAAQHLLDDGRFTGDANPWSSPLRGKRPPDTYTDAEIDAAIRRCARTLGRHPSSNDYAAWSGAQKRRARKTGALDRTPAINTVYRRVPTGPDRWRRAVARALVTETEIAEAITARFGSLQEVDRTSSSATQETDGAREYTLDGQAIRRRRTQLGITDTALRERLQLQLGPWRRLLNGRDLCTSDTAEMLADLLRTTVTQIARAQGHA